MVDYAIQCCQEGGLSSACTLHQNHQWLTVVVASLVSSAKCLSKAFVNVTATLPMMG